MIGQRGYNLIVITGENLARHVCQILLRAPWFSEIKMFPFSRYSVSTSHMRVLLPTSAEHQRKTF